MIGRSVAESVHVTIWNARDWSITGVKFVRVEDILYDLQFPVFAFRVLLELE